MVNSVSDIFKERLDALKKKKGTNKTNKTDKKGWFQSLDDMLRDIHHNSDVSFKAMKKIIRDHGICLADGGCYGRKLRSTLLRSPKLIVSLKEAKTFTYLKLCLVEV
jgi:hypothetical protein